MDVNVIDRAGVIMEEVSFVSTMAEDARDKIGTIATELGIALPGLRIDKIQGTHVVVLGSCGAHSAMLLANALAAAKESDLQGAEHPTP
ncbi:hypothetical protein [Streptomyces sp. AN091965]|uniref:hypothetical protein n=1 Tax=Streptomyces sp. AN091965 TaxID=2927803 RepID=UPI001F6030D9|nr:hypothetical protein [Streptomyces sp. AN091965]MCI3931546.1 hypothetical protein [Streptomyces sp. AN091965]